MPDATFILTRRKPLLGKPRWHWNLVAPNGQIIATSESYTRRENAVNGVAAVKAYAAGAELIERTADGAEV